MELACDPAIPLLSRFPKKAVIQTDKKPHKYPVLNWSTVHRNEDVEATEKSIDR